MPPQVPAARPPGSKEKAGVSCVPAGDRSPERRELGVHAQRLSEPAPCLGAVTEAALDHAAVEHLERIERAEPECAPRMALRLPAVAGPLERPSQDVVPVDRRPFT